MKTFCDYYNKNLCSSCSSIELSYQEQIGQKENKLKESLAFISELPLLPSVTSRETAFRNKAKFVVTGTIERPIIGLQGTDDWDQGREILKCPLHHQKINDVIKGMPEFIGICHLSPYQIKERKGELKGLVVFYSESSNEMYLRFILRSKESIDRIKKNLQWLNLKYPFIKTVSANIQPIPHPLPEGEEEIIFSDKQAITHFIQNNELNLSPRAFVQTNEKVATLLYSTAAEWIKELRPKKFAELFCGQGAFSFLAAPYIHEGLGIEINHEAVLEANKTASRLKLTHLNFKCADAANVEDEILKYAPDCILVNPPRRGLGESLKIIKAELPQYLIYSSCSIESLEKDLKELNSNYKVAKIQIFDMFPHTNHFETLVLLQKN